MIIKINMQSEVPIYLQLRNEIVKGIGRGEFEPGESLPTSSAPQDNRIDEKLADELELLSAEAKFHGMTLADFLELCQRVFNEMEVTAK